MGGAGIHSDATARGDVGPFPSFEEFFDNQLTLRLRHVLCAIAKDVMESVEVVLGTPHSGRGLVVFAMVVPREEEVAPTSGARVDRGPSTSEPVPGGYRETRMADDFSRRPRCRYPFLRPLHLSGRRDLNPRPPEPHYG